MTCAVFSDFVPSCKTSVKIVILNPVSSPSIIGAAASGRRTYKGGRRASRAAPFVGSYSTGAAADAAGVADVVAFHDGEKSEKIADIIFEPFNSSKTFFSANRKKQHTSFWTPKSEK